MGLFLVATPIGNLADISLRAIEILKSSDYILCEDTRHSGILLRHHGIEKSLKSYHKFNEAAREDEVIADLQAGKSIALISDAGTPGIADPGERLVRRCVLEGITVTPVPGACAAIAALTASGLPTHPFQFVGFLPRRTSQLKATLQQMLHYLGTSVCYESPLRLKVMLEVVCDLDPHRQIVIARELTKKFEEFVRGTAQELLSQWIKPPKGEIVVLIAPGKPLEVEHEMTLQEHVAYFEEEQELSRSDAIKAVAELRNISKKLVYKAAHELDG